ncbi:MAG: hypothetical protein KTR16_07745, partial [Acidiferrobacterales bacterium]|nr:hypothetical protein [Acidiferrobacterales bacterium]
MSDSTQVQSFFHIGYARAASTFLQKAVFPALTGIQYIPRNRFRVRESEKRRFKENRVLMSREAGRRIYQRCDDVRRVFGSRIVISLRRHDSLVSSNYRLHIKRGHSTEFASYLDLENDRGVWKKDQFEYMRLINYVEKSTGQKPIVLIFEDYIQDPDYYIAYMCAALDCQIDQQLLSHKPVHKSYTDKQLRLRRQVAGSFGNRDFDQNLPHNTSEKHGRVLQYLRRRVMLWSSALFMLFAKFVPESFISDKELIDKAQLKKIQDYYQADWQACQDYVTEQNLQLG